MPREVISTPDAPQYPSYSQAVKVGNTIYVAGTVGVVEVFDEFFPDVRPPRSVSKLGVDRPGILVSNAMVAVTD
jgi:2-iminobutanoate/2-iminopropanoate deaminase